MRVIDQLHKMLVLFFICFSQMAYAYEDIGKQCYYFYDTEDVINESNVHNYTDLFEPIEKYALGVTHHTIWLMIPTGEIDGFFENKFLSVGNQRTYDIRYFKMQEEGNIEIEESIINHQHFLNTDKFQKGDTLFVSLNDFYVPNYINVYLVKDAVEQMNFRLFQRSLSQISLIVLLLSMVLTVTYYIISKQKFFIFYFLHVIGYFSFLLSDSGIGLNFLSQDALNIIAPGANVLYISFSVPLMVVSMLKSKWVNYKNYYIYLALTLSIDVVTILFYPSYFVDVIIIEFVIFQALVILIMIFHSKKQLYQKAGSFFWKVLIFSLVFPVIKALQNLGLVQYYEIVEPIFSLLIIFDFVLWIILIVSMIRSDMKEKLILGERASKINEMQKNAQIEGQESERNWIGRELHDNIGSGLSAIKLLIQKDKNLARENLSKVMKQLEVTGKIFQKTEKLYSFEDLFDYIDTLNSIEKYEITIRDLPEDESLRQQASLYISSIQECINNAIKHGKASVIEILFEVIDSNVKTVVKDNGSGSYALSNSLGLGLGLKSKIINSNQKIEYVSMNLDVGFVVEMNIKTLLAEVG